MKKKILTKPISVLIALTFVFTSFLGFAKVKALENIQVTGVTLDKSTLNLEVGASAKLTATIQPDNATIKDILWQSDNTTIAQVVDGTVRGYGEGTTIIRATTKDQGKVTYCIVTVTKGSAVTPILNVKADDDNNGVPDFVNPSVPFVIEGRVSGDFRTTINNISAGPLYIQDETSGIGVQGLTAALPQGTKIKVTGTVIFNGGETQFLATSFEIVNAPIEAVSAIKVSTKDSMLEKNEGTLIAVQGKITKMAAGEIFVNDATAVENEARIILGSNFVLITQDKASVTTTASLKVGDTVKVAGIAGQDPAGHKIQLRDSKDLSLLVTEENKDTTNKEVKVFLNKKKITLKPGKFEYINVITTPGNLKVTSIKIKGTTPQLLVTTDKKNIRLIKIYVKPDSLKATQTFEIEAVVNGKTYVIPVEVSIDGKKPVKVKEQPKSKTSPKGNVQSKSKGKK